ncbi:MAG: ATP-binding protein [Bacteroidota bacterium]
MDNSIRKIAIVGPESTGKTTLAKQLAEKYETKWVPEYAREYLEALDRNYVKDDLLVIARGQLQSETQYETSARELLICDTNLVVIKVWSEYKYGSLDKWIEHQLENRSYDLYLLTNCDIPWEEDVLRENPENREYLFKQYEAFLKESQLPYVVIEGSEEEERLAMAIKNINNL